MERDSKREKGVGYLREIKKSEFNERGDMKT